MTQRGDSGRRAANEIVRFALAKVAENGMLLNEPLIAVEVCTTCGVLVCPSVGVFEHEHKPDDGY